MDFYKNQMENYRKASQEAKEASKRHWIRCHRENLNSGRNDLIIFSARIIANMAIVDSEM